MEGSCWTSVLPSAIILPRSAEVLFGNPPGLSDHKGLWLPHLFLFLFLLWVSHLLCTIALGSDSPCLPVFYLPLSLMVFSTLPMSPKATHTHTNNYFQFIICWKIIVSKSRTRVKPKAVYLALEHSTRNSSRIVGWYCWSLRLGLWVVLYTVPMCARRLVPYCQAMLRYQMDVLQFN